MFRPDDSRYDGGGKWRGDSTFVRRLFVQGCCDLDVVVTVGVETRMHFENVGLVQCNAIVQCSLLSPRMRIAAPTVRRRLPKRNLESARAANDDPLNYG